MTDDRSQSQDFPSLAAEYALGCLDGADWQRARSLATADPHFREEVARWLGRFSAMLEEIEPKSPPASVWAAIQARTGRALENGNVVALRRKVTLWRGVTGAMTALAASLALFVLLRPPLPAPVQPAPSTPMVARLSSDKQVALIASWDPQGGRLLLATATGVPVDKGRSGELWVIPAGGTPRSLGLMPQSDEAVIRLSSETGSLMRDGARIAVSVEPLGGSPTGAPTGPVVASGTLKTA